MAELWQMVTHGGQPVVFWIISRVNPPSVPLYFLKEKITLRKGICSEVNLGFLDYLMGLLERWSHLGTWRVRPRLGLQTSIHTCPSAWGFPWALVNKGMNIWGLSLKSNLEWNLDPWGFNRNYRGPQESLCKMLYFVGWELVLCYLNSISEVFSL